MKIFYLKRIKVYTAQTQISLRKAINQELWVFESAVTAYISAKFYLKLVEARTVNILQPLLKISK